MTDTFERDSRNTPTSGDPGRARTADPTTTDRVGRFDCGTQHHEVLEGGEVVWTCDDHDPERDIHRTSLTIDGRYAKMWRTPVPDVATPDSGEPWDLVERARHVRQWGSFDGLHQMLLDEVERLRLQDGGPPADDSMSMLLADQWSWSQETFGPGRRTGGVLAHIKKELVEIEADPTDVEEWTDVAGLALDGACRAGHTPTEVVAAWRTKIAKNRARSWPDWRTASEDEPIEHDR